MAPTTCRTFRQSSAHQSRRPPLPTPDSGVDRRTNRPLYRGVHPHQLRHTAASLAAKEGAKVSAVQKSLPRRPGLRQAPGQTQAEFIDLRNAVRLGETLEPPVAQKC